MSTTHNAEESQVHLFTTGFKLISYNRNASENPTHKHMCLSSPQIYKNLQQKLLEICLENVWKYKLISQYIGLLWFRATSSIINAIWSKLCCKMAPVKSLEVNGKISTAFKFLIVLKESISTSCIEHIHCRCISAVSLDIYNCSFLCFKLSRV